MARLISEAVGEIVRERTEEEKGQGDEAQQGYCQEHTRGGLLRRGHS